MMTTINGIMTAILIVLFIGIWVWAWSSKNKDKFDKMARLPLEEFPEREENKNDE